MSRTAALCSWLRCALLCASLLGGADAYGAGIRVVYPSNQTATDSRFNDLIEILHVALEKTVPAFGPYELLPSEHGMNEARYMAELKRGTGRINVAWSSTSVDKERELLPIRIPLHKGLLGYRIALIARDKQARIDQVRTIDDLKKLAIGQGIGWGDVDVYESNGLHVVTSQYETLFKMVTIGRFDLFPRGIGEVFAEFAARQRENPALAIEQNMLLYYPWPYYFFFNKHDIALQQRIESGLRQMLRDGSFDAIFRKYNLEAIKRADLQHRRVIVLKNPLLPKETPLDDRTLWFDPLQFN